MKLIIIIFIVSLICVFFNSYIAQFIIHQQGSFPYKGYINSFQLPHYISGMANFDGVHYIRIAKIGYYNYEQAFFPLYPLLIHVLNILFQNFIITGIIISAFSFLLGLIFFKKYIEKWIGSYKSIWAIILVISFPTSFFFVGVYSESVFFLFVMLALYNWQNKRFFLGAFFSVIASLSRLQGVLLFLPFIISLLPNEIFSKEYISGFKKIIKNTKLIFLSFSPFIGLLLYSMYLYTRFKDPLIFYHAQALFGANRSASHIILLPQVIFRYFKIIVTGKFEITYFIALLELITFLSVLLVLVIDLIVILSRKTENSVWRLSLNIFSLTNLLLPTLTGTLSSVPRYSLFCFTFFIVLAQLKTFLKLLIIVIFLIFHIVILSLFTQGYFVS